MTADAHPDRLYLGWQYATPHADPGPPPRSPGPVARPPEPHQAADRLARRTAQGGEPHRQAAQGRRRGGGADRLPPRGLRRRGMGARRHRPPRRRCLPGGRGPEPARDLARRTGAARAGRRRTAAGRAAARRPAAAASARTGQPRAARPPVAGAAVCLREPEAVVRRPRPRRDRPGGRGGRHAGRLVGGADHVRRLPARHGRRGDHRRPVGRGRRGRPGRTVRGGGRRAARHLGTAARPAAA